MRDAHTEYKGTYPIVKAQERGYDSACVGLELFQSKSFRNISIKLNHRTRISVLQNRRHIRWLRRVTLLVARPLQVGEEIPSHLAPALA
jgi:hypothetical protein